jgi:tetratricopeptide (TPR) repeat protein
MNKHYQEWQKRVDGTVTNRNIYFACKSILPEGTEKIFTLEKPQELVAHYTEKLLNSKHEKELSRYYHLRGCVYFDSDQLEFALNDFENSLKFDQTNFLLFYDLAGVYLTLGDFIKVWEYCQKCIQMSPEFPLVYLIITLCHSQKNNFDLAFEACRTCQKLDPQYLSAYYSEGYIYQYHLKDLSKALEVSHFFLLTSLQCYLKVIEMSKKISRNQKRHRVALSYSSCGIIYGELKDFEKADYYFSKAIELENGKKKLFLKKEQFYHLFRRGAHYFKNSKEEKAFEDFEKALAIAPNIDKAVHIYLERANHFYTKQKYQEALEDYLQFLIFF